MPERIRSKKIIAPLLILLLAAILRLPFADTYVMWADEFSVQMQGIRIALAGQHPLVGTQATFQGLTHHSAFTSYLLAIPYTFFPDPALARSFVGLLGVLTVAIWYATINRYFGRNAALIAGLLIATLPLAVYWSRFVWNPNLGLMFVPLWFLTGLRAYHDGKRRAQIMHWLVLSANIQSQSVLLYLLPISFALLLWHLLLHPKRLQTLLASMIGVACFIASLVPWGIGLQRYATDNPALAEVMDVSGTLSTFNFAGLAKVPSIFGRIVGATAFPESELNWHQDTVGLWTRLPLNAVGWLVVLLALIGISGLIIQGLRAPKAHTPSLVIAGMSIVPFGIILFADANQPITDNFFVAVTFAASGAAALALAHFWKQARWVVMMMTTLIVTAYIIITASHLWWLHQHPYDHPNGNITALSEQIEVVLQYGDLLLILRERAVERALTPPLGYQSGELWWSWSVMQSRYPVYPVDDPGDTIIFPYAQHPVIVSRPFSTLIPAWFGAGEIVGYADRYLIVPLEQNMADQINQFAETARILGVYSDTAFCDGQAGSVTLLWQPLVNQPENDYHFSIRLVDADGQQQAQVDKPTLHHEWWQTDDLVLSHIEIPEVAGAATQMRVILYNVMDTIGLDVVDTAGNPVNYFVEAALGCTE